MKVLKPIQNHINFSFVANVVPRSPDSGFSLCIGSTGETYDFLTGISFVGRSGIVFDQSGNFFGGYYSGRSIEIEGHIIGDRLSYFCDGVLMNNNIFVTGNFNAVEFNKLNDSTAIVDFNYY